MALDEYHLANYWDTRYDANPQLFDFYAEIPLFSPYFEPFLKLDSKILILGAGTSREPFQLYDKGFHAITAVDFSPKAKAAVEEHLMSRPEIDYQIADAANFEATKLFDFVFDKGLLDCVLSDPAGPEERLLAVLTNVRSQMSSKAVWCSITFDNARDDIIEETMPGAFRIDRNDVKIDVYGVRDPQKVFCYVITKK